MNKQYICGHYTIDYNPCKKRLSPGKTTCHKHSHCEGDRHPDWVFVNEEIYRKEENVVRNPLQNRTNKTKSVSKKVRGPKRNTLSFYILQVIYFLSNKVDEGKVKRKKASIQSIRSNIRWFALLTEDEVSPGFNRLVLRLCKSMEEKGYLKRIKNSFSIEKGFLSCLQDSTICRRKSTPTSLETHNSH